MTMPVDVALVRHGLSEGNDANKRSRHGDHSAFTEEFKNRHSSLFRLTDEGIKQIIAAGDWIRGNIAQPFDRYYVSEYLRAMETAHYLRLPGASWYLELYLRERDHGALDVISQEERRAKYAEEIARRDRDGFFWAPPGGESMADVCLRVDRILDKWHRECSDMRVIAVAHAETIWCFRVRLERLTNRQYLKLNDDQREHIENGQVLHYTRRHPETGRYSKYLAWMRSICPWDPQRCGFGWREIARPKYTNEDLLAEVEMTPRLVNDGQ